MPRSKTIFDNSFSVILSHLLYVHSLRPLRKPFAVKYFFKKQPIQKKIFFLFYIECSSSSSKK